MAEVPAHSFSEHTTRLNVLCRVCGERVLRQQKDKRSNVRLCANYSAELLQFFNLDVASDEEGKHPTCICMKCYSKLMKMKNNPTHQFKSTKECAAFDIERMSEMWTTFDPDLSISQCTACRFFQSTCHAGRPKKRSAPVKRSAHENLDQSDLCVDTYESLSTSFCQSTSTPAKKPRTFYTQTSPITPKTPATDVAISPFAELKRKTVFLDSDDEDIDKPLTAEEEKLLTRLVRRKLRQSSDKITVRCKTRGQPIVLKKVTQPRKSSTLASSPLKKKRSHMIQKIRMNVSGNSKEDVIKQHGSEIKRTARTHREQILQAAGCGQKRVTKKQSTALRAFLQTSWEKHRLQKRFFRSIGINFESEKKEREAQEEAMFGEIQIEKTQLTFVDEEGRQKEKETAVGKIKDIPQLVENLLDQYDRDNKLTWHDNTIPQDEIWVKIGGDHGGGTFKLMLQIANLRNTNSKHNTCLLTIVDCKDSPDNLRRLIDPYKQQLAVLQSMTWRDKKIKVTLFGDYDFLLKLYGLSGAQGTHPCLYCTASKSQTQNPPYCNEGNITQRSLQGIKRDYHKYKHSKRKIAKLHNNVIREPIIDIELGQVAPPYLHILLGVVKKHHDLLEGECHSLDKQIGQSLASQGKQVGTDSAFSEFVDKLKQIQTAEEDKRVLETRIVFNEPEGDSTPLSVFQKEQRELTDMVVEKDEDIEHLKSQADLPNRTGPVTQQLDVVLQKHKIHTQAYHGRSFIGNHCHKYLKPETIEHVCDSVVNKTSELTQDTDIIHRARNICHKFKTLNTLFSRIHTNISHQRPLTDSDVDMLDSYIKEYMSFFRKEFAQTRVIPKQHILENHCIPFIQAHNIGLALLGEQGGEETHAVVNALKRKVWGLKTQEERLRVMMKEHMTIVAPTLQGVMPQVGEYWRKSKKKR